MTNEERQKCCAELRTADELAIYWRKLAADELERLAALAQSDAAPKNVRGMLEKAIETWNKQPPGPDSILHELGDCPTQSEPAQSDAEPAQPQTLRDAAENLLIAIGMGWDLEGCAENLRAALTQSGEYKGGDATVTGPRPSDPNLVISGPDGSAKSSGPLAQSDADQGWTNAIRAARECDQLNLRIAELEHALAQSNAEPVAWKIERLRVALGKIAAICRDYSIDIAPPRPDTSAGLLEAAEMAEECAGECFEDRKALLSAYALRDFAKLLRARAADRSWK